MTGAHRSRGPVPDGPWFRGGDPEHDAWTPLALSARTLAALPGPTDTVILREGGHVPVEDPALDDLVTAIERLIARHAG